jgi:N-methylhydantoinase B
VGKANDETRRRQRIPREIAGTGPAVSRGINVPLCYARAFSLFSVKALTIPEIPNNAGASNPIMVTAPPGCLYNPQPQRQPVVGTSLVTS